MLVELTRCANIVLPQHRNRQTSIAGTGQARDLRQVLTIVVQGSTIVVQTPKTWHSARQTAISEFTFRWSMADSNRPLAWQATVRALGRPCEDDPTSLRSQWTKGATACPRRKRRPRIVSGEVTKIRGTPFWPPIQPNMVCVTLSAPTTLLR